MQIVDLGEPKKLTSQWWDVSGAGVEPSAITLTITKPDASTVVLTKPGLTQGATVAEWYYEAVVDQVGLWRYVYVATISGKAITLQDRFLVGETSRLPGPCEPWCSWEDVTECTTTDLSSVSLSRRARILDIASGILWDLSGRIYPGVCETSKNLCPDVRCRTHARCDCRPWERIDLGPRLPVWAVWDVYVDGALLDPSIYRLDGRRWLSRIDGNTWPRMPDFMLYPATAFHASWAFGSPPPPAGREAATVYAREFALDCVGSACQLPKRITNIVREGVSFTVLDSARYLQDGRVGIPEVDTWIEADRRGRRARPGIFVPGAAGRGTRW